MECIKCKNQIKPKKQRKPKPFKYPIIDGVKECSNCHNKLNIILFDLNSNGTIKPICKDCRKIKNAEYYHKQKISTINNSINKHVVTLLKA